MLIICEIQNAESFSISSLTATSMFWFFKMIGLMSFIKGSLKVAEGLSIATRGIELAWAMSSSCSIAFVDSNGTLYQDMGILAMCF
jgi:hypothetical protein